MTGGNGERPVVDGGPGVEGRVPGGAQPRIRRAGPGDIEAIVALVESAYRGPASRVGWTTEADWLDGVRTNPGEVGGIIAGPDSLMLVVEGDSLLASCQLERRGSGVAYFGMFAVRPAEQGKGTGKLLLAAAERWAQTEWAARVMRMTVVNVRTELIEWYGRRGYWPTGESEPFPYGDPAFGIPRVPDLAFTVLAKRLGPEASGTARSRDL